MSLRTYRIIFWVMVVAIVVMGAFLWWAAGDDRFWITSGLWAKLSRLSLIIAGGVASYFAALWGVGFRLADFNRRESP